MKVHRIHYMRILNILFKFCLITAFAAIVLNLQAAILKGDKDTPVKIGLLVSDSKSVGAIQGAEMAIRKANEKGGLRGTRFQLVVRSMEGPWGTGSKEAVNLIFEEKVWVLLGSHDGRNAHLVEQASAKAHVIFLSAWSGDPTLSRAFVPWYFSCIPDDIQQAESLVNEIYGRRKINRTAVIYDDEYDSRQALNNFLKITDIERKPAPMQFSYEIAGLDKDVLVDKIIRTNPECIVLFCKPAISIKIFRQIRQRKINQPVLGSLFLLNEDELSHNELRDYDDNLMVPSGDWSDSKYSSFSNEYFKTFGSTPGIVAAYAHDGMNLLIEAILKAGRQDRELIQKALATIHFEGVTGSVQFDEKGNRSGTFNIMNVKNGVPVRIKKD